MIEQAQQVLLAAISASLFGSAFSCPGDTDWDAVIGEAKAQAVTALISPVLPVRDGSADQCRAFYMRLLYEQDKLLRLLAEHNLPCVILKGCAAAVYYPKPHLRAMGDVDLLVPRDRFADAAKCMEENGYTPQHENAETEKPPRHISFTKNGIEFELHHHFSTSCPEADEILEPAIGRREYRELNGFRFPVLPETENGIVLLEHIHQHLTFDYLGLRQIIDWAMYCHAVTGNAAWEAEFAPLAEKIGLSRLARNVTAMCEKHLGLPAAAGTRTPAEEAIADTLLEVLLTAGNFGKRQMTSSRDSGARIERILGHIRHRGLCTYFRDSGLDNWKLCQKHRVLKPLAVPYGMVRFLVRGGAAIIRTGKYKEQLRYIRDKNQFDRALGLRPKETGK